MTHEELLAKIQTFLVATELQSIDENFEGTKMLKALRAVVKLHKPNIKGGCDICSWIIGGFVLYQVCPTIQAIEKELI